jgi:hypothetical protein
MLMLTDRSPAIGANSCSSASVPGVGVTGLPTLAWLRDGGFRRRRSKGGSSSRSIAASSCRSCVRPPRRWSAAPSVPATGQIQFGTSVRSRESWPCLLHLRCEGTGIGVFLQLRANACLACLPSCPFSSRVHRHAESWGERSGCRDCHVERAGIPGRWVRGNDVAGSGNYGSDGYTAGRAGSVVSAGFDRTLKNGRQ